MRSLQGKVALITGASKGIGKVIAENLASLGMRVALVARNQEALERIAKHIEKSGTRAIPIQADVTNIEDLKNAVHQTAKELGGLNVLINNAGVYSKANAAEADLEDWNLMLDVNLRAAMQLTRLALPEIKKESWGAIINIASGSGKTSHPRAAGYCASKFGIVGFNGSLYEDVREAGIKVSAICPGFVNTEMVADQGLIMEKTIQPQDVAVAVKFVLQFPDTGCPTEINIRPQFSPYPPAPKNQ